MAKASVVANNIDGCGLGLRRSLFDAWVAEPPEVIDFIECAPENWINIGGAKAKQFSWFQQRYPIVCHGLSLSLGGFKPLDMVFLAEIKQFLETNQVAIYSEHLSYCGDEGHLYDLLPIPFTEEAVHHVASRIKCCQDFLGRRIAIENVSYYCNQATDLTEIEFINAVLAEADCELLLDVNNVYVNSFNHGYDAKKFIAGLPAERVSYLHMAGHYQEDDVIIDTHGADVIAPVWRLLQYTYEIIGNTPTLLERDFNIPTLSELAKELESIRQLQVQCVHDSYSVEMRELV